MKNRRACSVLPEECRLVWGRQFIVLRVGRLRKRNQRRLARRLRWEGGRASPVCRHVGGLGEEVHVTCCTRAGRSRDLTGTHVVGRVESELIQLGVDRNQLHRMRVGLGERAGEAGLVGGDRVVLLVV